MATALPTFVIQRWEIGDTLAVSSLPPTCPSLPLLPGTETEGEAKRRPRQGLRNRLRDRNQQTQGQVGWTEKAWKESADSSVSG